MLLSIVITSYNRSALVAQFLQHFARHTDPESEVVVAIEGSRDDTEGMLARLHVPCAPKWVDIRCPGYCMAVAHNLGILAAYEGASPQIYQRSRFAHAEARLNWTAEMPPVAEQLSTPHGTGSSVA